MDKVVELEPTKIRRTMVGQQVQVKAEDRHGTSRGEKKSRKLRAHLKSTSIREER